MLSVSLNKPFPSFLLYLSFLLSLSFSLSNIGDSKLVVKFSIQENVKTKVLTKIIHNDIFLFSTTIHKHLYIKPVSINHANQCPVV